MPSLRPYDFAASGHLPSPTTSEIPSKFKHNRTLEREKPTSARNAAAYRDLHFRARFAILFDLKEPLPVHSERPSCPSRGSPVGARRRWKRPKGHLRSPDRTDEQEQPPLAGLRERRVRNVGPPLRDSPERNDFSSDLDLPLTGRCKGRRRSDESLRPEKRSALHFYVFPFVFLRVFEYNKDKKKDQTVANVPVSILVVGLTAVILSLNGKIQQKFRGTSTDIIIN